MKNNTESEIKQILDSEVDYHHVIDESGNTLLILAATLQDIESIERLINANVDIDIQNNDGETALIRACQFESLDIIKILIDGGADVNFASKNGGTPLIYASIFNHTEAMKLLIKSGADVNVKEKKVYEKNISLLFTVHHYFRRSKNILYYAVLKGHYEAVKILLENGAKIDKNIFNAVLENTNIEILNLLIDYGLEINKVNFIDYDKRDDSAVDALRLMIDKGLKIDLELFVTLRNNRDMVSLLIENTKNKNLLQEFYTVAQSDNNIEILDILEKHAIKSGSNSVNAKMVGYLHIKILPKFKNFIYNYLINVINKKYNSLEIDKEIRKKFSSIGYVSNLSEIIKGKKDIKYIEAIIPAHDINQKDKDGMTALMWACKLDKLELVELLLKNKADDSIVDNNNKTALQYATNNSDITHLLRNYQALKLMHNPKKLVRFLSNFTIDKPIKYTTHNEHGGLDIKKDYGSFDKYKDAIKDQFNGMKNELEKLSPNLYKKIYTFLLDESPELDYSWCSETKINIGWSSLEGLKEHCDSGENPFDFKLPKPILLDRKTELTTFGEVIELFKQEIEIRRDFKNLNNIFASIGEKLGNDFTLSTQKLERQFYTDVEKFTITLDKIFGGIKQYNDYKNIKVTANELEGGVIELKITQVGSPSTLNAKDLLKEVEDGDFADIKANLTNLCDWSVESSFEDVSFGINYLKSNNVKDNVKDIVELDYKPDGFTHILRFYKS